MFAHKEVSDIQEANELLAKTSVDELKELFAFLSALYTALWEQFHNGLKPSLNIRQFVLPPDPAVPRQDTLPGEIVYREGHVALMSMLPWRTVKLTRYAHQAAYLATARWT